MHIEVNHTSRQLHGLFSGSTTLNPLKINDNKGGYGNSFFKNNKNRNLTVNVSGLRLKTWDLENQKIRILLL